MGHAIKTGAGLLLGGCFFRRNGGPGNGPLGTTQSYRLISSCRNPTSIPWYLRTVGAFPTWPHLSKSLCRSVPGFSGRFLGAETSAQRDLLIQMFLETPDDFAQWTVWAIRQWEGCETRSLKIHHIHGENDHLIPVHGVRPDRIIPGGGHLINLTHPREVNEFIGECLKR